MKLGRPFVVLSSFLALMFPWAVGRPAAAGVGHGQFGKALDGLTMEQRRLFRDGKEAFQKEEDAGDGLGPIFNGVSCVFCHSEPSAGGSTPIVETRAQRVDGGSVFELPGGSLFQSEAISAACAEAVPANATVTAGRQTTALFGSGLIEAIPDRDIERYAAAQARAHPAQAGRANHVTDVASGALRVGRFGWKAQQATLLAFSGDAYVNEMGITSRLFPVENAPNGNLATLAACDTVQDPEDTDDDVTAFANFMRMLAPPPRDSQWERERERDGEHGGGFDRRGGRGGEDHGRGAHAPSGLAFGESVFERVGCAVCHVAGFRTASPIEALNGQRVDAYSDFLLHDVGTGDGIVQGGAGANELRTPPLWGISESAPYLHDGSAATIKDAIDRHGNQGAAARKGFDELPWREQQALLAFLDSI
jgi:CxxC motif-containing protein (DUF1111 family)